MAPSDCVLQANYPSVHNEEQSMDIDYPEDSHDRPQSSPNPSESSAPSHARFVQLGNHRVYVYEPLEPSFAIPTPPIPHNRRDDEVLMDEYSSVEDDVVMVDLEDGEQDIEGDETEDTDYEPSLEDDETEDTDYEPSEGDHECHPDILVDASNPSWALVLTRIADKMHNDPGTLSGLQRTQLAIIRDYATLRRSGMQAHAASVQVAQQWRTNVDAAPELPESSSLKSFAQKVRTSAHRYRVLDKLAGWKLGRPSLLDIPLVHGEAIRWLTSLEVGQVTPRLFQQTLNANILPALDIHLKKPLSVRTATRWLKTLGWKLTVLRKGSLRRMKGHDRLDVIDYRDRVFLPRIAEYERRMVHFEEPELTPVGPALKEGEREIVPYFQDESSFQEGEYKMCAW